VESAHHDATASRSEAVADFAGGGDRTAPGVCNPSPLVGPLPFSSTFASSKTGWSGSHRNSRIGQSVLSKYRRISFQRPLKAAPDAESLSAVASPDRRVQNTGDSRTTPDAYIKSDNRGNRNARFAPKYTVLPGNGQREKMTRPSSVRCAPRLARPLLPVLFLPVSSADPPRGLSRMRFLSCSVLRLRR